MGSRTTARAWLVWVGAGIGAGVLGLGAGVSGLLGNPVEPTEFASVVVAPVEGTALLDCAAGEPVGTMPRNERVYVIARSPDSQWLAIRSVAQGHRTVWVAADALDVDQFPIRIPDLLSLECLLPEVAP